MKAESRLLSGIVNRDDEHIELLYGDANNLDPEDFIQVALVAPGPGKDFTVQYTIVADNADARRMVKEVQKELRYYLIELGERDPWLYARYHCGTALNWYSPVHWCRHRGQSVRSPS